MRDVQRARRAIAVAAVGTLLFVGLREFRHSERSASTASAPRASVLSGRRVFVVACQECHTVVGHETQPRGGGGDLSIEKLSLADEESLAAIMPVHPPLATVELKDVALYVIETQRHFAHRHASPR